ncbi:unnamed protein product [Blepharisma stoltei]|uniref:Uncharacterized protein n=1 Tax=Blepharisma stoltei TaxID=1481888 RepID=A0AAU9JNL9_9CILI|nr:unnamed protein product [Blepharisma stoltei]
MSRKSIFFTLLFENIKMKFVSILFFIHIVTTSALSIGSHDSFLDPGRITWPKENWVNNPIEVSKTNVGSVVSITISFRPSTSLSSSIIEVIFPSTFITRSLIINSSSLIANTDTSVYYSGLKLPTTVGAHGPIGVVSRSSQTGQIYDINYIFGFIATSPIATTDDSLLISTVSGYHTPAVKSTDGLYFIFTLTINLWKHDIIEIIPDDNWTPSSTVRCNSQDIPGIKNVIYGPNSDNKLPCALAEKSSSITGPKYKAGQSGKNSIYIYGISQDVFLKDGSLPVIIRVSTFTLPGYTRLATQESWSINIWRWGTNTLIAQYTALIGPVSTGAGAIKLSSWAPVSSILASDIPAGATIFTKVTFTNPHEVPSGGKCIINFSNVDIKTPSWWSDLDGSNSQNSLCYLTTYIEGASCTIDSKTQVTIKFSIGKPSGEMSIALLTTFSTAAKINSITTYTSSLYKIDALSSGVFWKLSSSNFLLSKFQYHAYKSAVSNKYPSIGYNTTWSSGDLIGADQSKDLYWAIKSHAGVAWTESTLIKVYLPMSTSLALTESYIDSSNVYDLIDLFTAQQYLSSHTSATYTLSIKTNSIIIYYPSALLAGHYLVFSYSGNSALPYVQSNLGTFYECWAKVTTGTQTEIGSSVFSAFTTDYLGVGLATLPLCSDNNAIGIPILITFIAKIMAIDFTSESNLFAVEIEIFNGGKLGLNINDGDLIPISSSVNGTYASLTVSSSGSSIIKVRGLGVVSPSTSTIKTFIATGDITSLPSFQSVMTVYYTRLSDPTLHYVLYKSTSGSIALGGSSHLFDASSASTSSSWTVSEIGGLLITGATLTTPTSSGDYIGINLPYGFSISSDPIFQINNSPMSSLYYASSYTNYNSVGFILGTASTSFFNTPTTISLTNIRAPYNSGSFSFNIFSATTVGGACNLADATLTNTVNPGIINNYDISCSPKEIYTRGPDSADTEMTISVKTIHDIPGNGKIDIALDSNWQYFDNNCEVEGLDDYDDTTKVNCAISGTSLEITGFSNFIAGEIIINILHTFPPSSGSTANCVSSIATYGLWNTPIDTASSLSQQISLISSSLPGTCYGLSAIAYPNFAGAKDVDIFLTFSFTKPLPWNTIIYISPGFSTWTQQGDIKDYCWSNIDYLSCNINNGKIELILSKKLDEYYTVQIYLDSALDLPINAGVTSNGWQISSSWNSVTITSDSLPGIPFKVEPSINAQISIWGISVNDRKNTGETTSYSFNFSSEVAVEIGDYFVIQFPRDFDAYIGDAVQSLPDCFPDDWFLDCSSSLLGKVVCRVDHWYLIVDEISYRVAENKYIDLTVNSVKNPSAGVTGYFSILQYNELEAIKAFIGTKKTVSISAAPNLVTFKGVSTENTELSTDRASYFFDWYATGIYDSDYVFYITFPPQYNLKLNLNRAVGCIPSYFDDSNNPIAGMAWNNDGSCTVSGSSVFMLIAPGVSKEFQSQSRIRLNIYDINNPEWGLQRFDDLWDIQDPSSFGWYSLFSEKFEVSILNTKTHLVSSRSYGVLHSGFLGYSLNSYLIDINGYDPKTIANKVQIIPGTQSKDIPIYLASNWPLRSKSLKIMPKTNENYPDNGKLSYTSIHHNWIMWQMVSKIYFRVAADISIDNGIYCIDWDIKEITQEKVDNPIYSAPLSFLVEVCSQENSLVSINVADIPKLYMGTTSIPIAISLEYAPANDLMIKLNTDSQEISIYPSTLSFLPDIDILYFQIEVSPSYSQGVNYPKVSFTLEGTDFSAYSTPSAKTVRVIEMAISTPQAKISLESDIVSGTEVVITANSLENGVVYWYLSCSGSIIPTFQELYNLTSDLVIPNSQATLQDKLDKEYAATETDYDPKKDPDISSFFRRKHSEHCSTFWASSQVLYSKVPILINLSFLMAGTSYTFATYLDNRLSSNFSSYIPTIESFTTKPLPVMQAFSVNFPGGISTTNTEPIRYILGKNMGINPDWLISAGVKTASSRRLQSEGTTSFIYYVLCDRSKSFYDSAKIIANFNSIQATNELASLVGINPTYSWNGVSLGVSPLWTENPILAGITYTQVTFIATQTQDGIICVSCTSSEISKATYAWQVIDSLDGNSASAHGNCINSTAEINSTLTVSSLNPSTNYTCHFTACNDYPLWPACIEAENGIPLANLTVATLSVELYDFGNFMQVSFSLILIIN